MSTSVRTRSSMASFWAASQSNTKVSVPAGAVIVPLVPSEHFSIRLTLPVSSPGLTGQSSILGRWLLDRPVNPRIKSGEGDDSIVGVNLIETCSGAKLLRIQFGTGPHHPTYQ